MFNIIISIGMYVYLTFLVVFGLKVYFEDQREWERFKIEYNCRMVTKSRFDTSWQCDDGVTYWR